mgnify:CR=1 FL=1
MNDKHDLFEMQDPIPSDEGYLNTLRWISQNEDEDMEDEDRIRIYLLNLRICLVFLLLVQVVLPLFVFGFIWINLTLWQALICIIGLLFQFFYGFNSFTLFFSFFRRLRVKQ